MEWWPKIRKPLLLVGSMITIGLVVAIVGGYLWGWDWIGVNRSIGPVVQANQQYRPEKTLWDWVQLLIAPAVIAFGTVWITYTLQKNEQKATEKRANNDRQIAFDNQQEASLQAYLDFITELLVEYRTHQSRPGINIISGVGPYSAPDPPIREEEEIANVTRVRTLILLRRLEADTNRQKTVLQFLSESGLLASSTILKGADLSEIDLSTLNLAKANLSEANLQKAKLSKVSFRHADLSRANLYRADLQKADLQKADLRSADFREANLKGAQLGGAALDGANLKDATGIPVEELIEELKKKTIFPEGVVLPDGSIYSS